MYRRRILLAVVVGLCIVVVRFWYGSVRHRSWSQGVTEQSRPAAAQELPRIEVITDAAAIAEAHREAQARRDKRVADLLGSPAEIPFYDDDALDLLGEGRARSVAAMKAILDRGTAEDRVAAAILLVKLGDAGGRSAVCGLLDDPAAQEPLLSRLGYLEEEKAGEWPEVRAWVLKSLDTSDAKRRRAAVRLVMQLDVRPAGPKLAELATRPGIDEDGWISSCAADRVPSLDLLESIIQRLNTAHGGRERYWLTMALADLIGSPDGTVSGRALDSARVVLQAAGTEEFQQIGLVDAVTKHGGARAAALLGEVYESGQSPGLRGAALVGLAKLEPAATLPKALKALSDEKLRRPAVAAIEHAAKGTQDAELIRELRRVASREKNGSRLLESIAHAMLEIGGQEAMAGVEAIVPRLGSTSVMEIRWALAGMTLDKAAERLMSLGLLDKAVADNALADLKHKEKELDDTEPALLALLDAAGLAIGFDVETGELPVGHDRLILDFASKSGGAFRPLAVQETWNRQNEDDDEADYTVQFVHGDRLYRFTARNFGDWYDVEAVVTAIHTALKDAGSTRQFHALDTGGQDAMFVFAEPGIMSEVSREFGLPLSTDLKRSEREGKEYERQVIEQLGKKGD